MPAGSFSSWNADFATSWMPMPRSVPAMAKRPSLNSMSSSAASSRCAASFLPLAMIFSLTRTMAPPLIVVEREPPVPMPNATASVSPWMNLIWSGSTPSRSTRICVWMVAWPWPCEIEPVTKVMPPERVEADFGGLDGRIGGLLDGVGEADAAQHAALGRLLAPRLEALPVGELHGAVHVLLEAPAVVGEGERRLVGHGLRRDGVAPAQLRRIDLHLVGGDVDQPLDHVGRLGPAGAAIGRGAVRVGQHAGDRDMCSAGVV